jgi:hypothetical protein
MKIEKYYGIRELSATLDVSTDAARELLLRRQLAYRKIGVRLKFSESDLAAYLDRIRVAARDEALRS